MTTNSERLMLAAVGFSVLLTFVVLTQKILEEENFHKVTASPGAYEACSKIAANSRRFLSPGSEYAAMEKCLLQHDPAYATAREAAMCQQAKSAGARPESFAAEFRKSCFGNG